VGLIQLERLGESKDGYLSFFEAARHIPFEIKRIYYIYDVPINAKRGMHAHKRLRQVLWCPYGHMEILLDDGREAVAYTLDTPDKLLLVEGQWRDMYWRQPGSVLCVAASDYYDEEDYVRDYDEFLRLVKEGYWSDER